LTKGHACGWSAGGRMTCVWSIGGMVTDFWSIGGVMTFAYWLWNVDIMRVDDVCNVGGMITYVWTVGGVVYLMMCVQYWWSDG